MWWRNISMRGKLLLGFGLLLIIFAAAVGLAWRNINKATAESAFLSDVLVGSIKDGTALERVFYDTFIVIEELERLGDDETAKAAKAQMETLKKGFDKMTDLMVAQPRLRGPKYWVDTVGPIYKNFIDSVNRTYTIMDNKNKLYTVIGNAGVEAGDATMALLNSFPGMLKEELQGNNDFARISSITDMWNTAGYILADVLDARRAMQKAMMDKDPDAMRKILAAFDKTKSGADKELSAVNDPERVKIAKRLVDAIGAYHVAIDNFAKAYDDLNKEAKVRGGYVATLNTETTNASTLAVNRVDDISTENVIELQDSIRKLVASAGAAIVLGVVIALLISRGIAGPLNRIVDIAERAENGDLTVTRGDFGYEGRDEMGKLVDAISKMVDAQESAMKDISHVAENLAGEAHNLSEIAEQSNASMEEIKASMDQVSALSEANGAALEECNAGVEEMSAGADTVARSATDSAEFLSETTSVSSNAIAAVDQVIKGMRNVETNAKVTEAKTRQLVTSVENVSGFVSVITGIADQTNLLALNAAIEAARAGEVGRGFAVVAEEVRKLAEESAKAAQNVNGIIGELQTGARESIEATTAAGKMLTETLVQAEGAQKELDGAMGGINKANDSIQSIAAVAEEQAASSKEVATGIDNATRSTMEMVGTVSNIKTAADNTAQAAQGVAEQSENIQSRVDALTEVVSRFKLKPNSEGAKARALPKAVKRS